MSHSYIVFKTYQSKDVSNNLHRDKVDPIADHTHSTNDFCHCIAPTHKMACTLTTALMNLAKVPKQTQKVVLALSKLESTPKRSWINEGIGLDTERVLSVLRLMFSCTHSRLGGVSDMSL